MDSTYIWLQENWQLLLGGRMDLGGTVWPPEVPTMAKPVLTRARLGG